MGCGASKAKRAAESPASSQRWGPAPSAKAAAARLSKDATLRDLLTRRPEIEKSFLKYDKSGNGCLEATEFRSFVAGTFASAIAVDGDGEFTEKLMHAMDLDGSGNVGLPELRAFLRVYNPKTQVIKRRSALLIVDVQNDFISGSLANPYDAQQIVPVINRLREEPVGKPFGPSP